MKHVYILALLIIFSGCAAAPPQTTPPTTPAPTAPPTTPQATSAPVTPQHGQPTSVLVDADWLNVHLNDKDLRILYVGSTAAARSSYDVGHIPGSVYLTIFKLLADESYSSIGSRGIVASEEKFEKVTGELGITNDMSVVVYGDPFDTWVARAFWTFKYYGHEKVYYLDGGVSSWKRKYPLTIETTEDPPLKVYSADVKPELRATGDYLLANLDNPSVVIHDDRARGEYTGEKILEGNERGGHIRGAVFLEWEKTLNPDGTFKSKEELKKMYEAIGITPDKEIIIYCQVGVRVSHTLLALKYILGYPNVRNYDGSWDEWANAKKPDGTYKYPLVEGSGPL